MLRHARMTSANGALLPHNFSVARAWKNREHRAVFGLIGGFAILVLKLALTL